MSRIGLVTPLRDGMNLVAKEYVAAQSDDDPGVLVLSRFAGAADELDGAVIVNPYDIEGTAEAMHLGLIMPLDERQDRWRRLFAQVQERDIVACARPSSRRLRRSLSRAHERRISAAVLGAARGGRRGVSNSST